MSEKVNLTIGGVALIKFKRDKRIAVNLIQIAKEFRELLSDNDYFLDAPFDAISLVLRYGDNENLSPQELKINKKHSQLETAVYINIHNLLSMSDEELGKYLRLAVIEVCCDISANYDLPYEFLDAHRKNV
ncbi:MAG TPA: hypothetical protein DIT58_02170 [Porticoccaceae bacterium]|nr:hypothetical protein [Porticoccaceae bacterium]